MKKLLIALVIAAVSLSIIPATSVQAATFNKNRLIDDELFTDTDSMTVQQIQTFLESKGSLLANWKDDVAMRRPGDNCVVHHPTNKTAAQIIYEAANAWNAQVYNSNGCAVEGAYWGQPAYSGYTLKTISPKALLVTLQKEQSLLSADGGYSKNPDSYKNPACCESNAYKLAYAMGYGVPDSGSINKKYLGFYNQINWAAWQLRFNYERSAGNTAWDNVSYITYSGPMIEGTFRRCGSCSLQSFDGYYPIDGSPLYMGNRSTASLYYYTPHTYPGFYGNYNFVQFYSDYFGSVFADTYKYGYHSQTANPSMMQGFSNSVKIRFVNKGSQAWYDNSSVSSAPEGTLPTYISTDEPTGFASQFSRGWPTPAIPSREFSAVFLADGITPAANQHVVQPGQVGEFTIQLTAPQSKPAGNHRLYFTLVRGGTGGGRLKGPLVWTTATVVKANYKAAYVDQSFEGTLSQSQSKSAYVRFKNTGNIDWYGVSYAPPGVSPIRLTTVDSINRNSPFSREWFAANRPVGNNFSAVYQSNGTTLAANQNVVKPGQIARFNLSLAATKNAVRGKFNDYLRLVREGANTPLFGPTMWFPIDYKPGTYKATWVTQSLDTTIPAGTAQTFVVRYKNTGTATWRDTTGMVDKMFPVRLAPTGPLNRTSQFKSPNWILDNRPSDDFMQVLEADGTTLAADQNEVLPGQIGEFRVRFTVPTGTAPGTYREKFILVKDGAKVWKMDEVTTMWFNIVVP